MKILKFANKYLQQKIVRKSTFAHLELKMLVEHKPLIF